VTLIVAPLGLPSGASAAVGTISGTVSAAGGGGLAGFQVCASDTTQSISFSSLCGTSGPGGTYSILNVPAGTYGVNFEAAGEYLGQWFDGKATKYEADPVTVNGGATTGSIDAQLARGAVVEGVITDATSGTGLEQIRACLIEGVGAAAKCATSGVAGAYRIVGVTSGDYRLRLEPEYGTGSNYLRQFYPDAETVAAGMTLHLTAGSTESGVDVAMHLGGSISGKVEDENGQPLGGAMVCAYPALGDAGLAYCYENSAQTASDGTYTIHALHSGEYKVSFRPINGNYLRQFYPDEPTRLAGRAVTVTAPDQTNGIGARLTSGGAISGTLTEAGAHTPIPYESVCATQVSATSWRCAQAKADGSYSIGELPSGEYDVEFAGNQNSVAGPYVPTFYGGSSNRAGASPVPVTVGHEAAGIDGEVERGGTISGLVTDWASHEAASAVYVCAYSGTEVVGRCDTTDQSGEYTIVGLAAGAYAVRFASAGGGDEQNFQIGNGRYLRQFYESAATESAATLVSSGPGTARTGIDVAMHEGGGIAGTVTGPLGEPLAGITACIVDTESALESYCGSTDAAGKYEIDGLYPGSYLVEFWGSGGLQTELSTPYYDDVEKLDEADSVAVSGTSVTPGIDAHLVVGGRIEGTVVDAFDGTPITGVQVCAVDVDRQNGNCGESGTAGHYVIPVAPGSYRVEFSYGYQEEGLEESEVEEFATQYFSGAATSAGATAVTVASGMTRPGIDAALAPAAARLDTVSVSRSGPGSGAVTSSPAGIDCGATCSDGFESRKTVTLDAEPTPGSTFAGWTGACSGTGPCQVRLTGAASVGATFESTPPKSPEDSTGNGSTSSGPAPTPGPPVKKPKKKPLRCKKGFATKKVGKTRKCVKPATKHHPRQAKP
jgi:protocatechuate 3,4-dioxygenase beta subunit